METFTGEILQAMQKTKIGEPIGIVHRSMEHSRDSYREPYIAARYIIGVLSSKKLRLDGQHVVIPTFMTADSDRYDPLDEIDDDLITPAMLERYRVRNILLERKFERDFGSGLRHPVIHNELYEENPEYYKTSHPAVEVVYGERLEPSGALAFAKGRRELAAYFENFVSIS